MLVTKIAPDFTATTVMPDNSFKDITLSDYRGKKVVLFFYPLDFTFVWPSELIAFNNRIDEFEKREVQVLGCSVDSQFSHLRWKEMDVNKGGIGNVKYPLISDLDKSIARAYDVLLSSTPATVLINDEEMDTSIGGNVTMRGSFLIDEEGVVRHAVLNDLPLGRNIDEMLRMIDALAFHTKNGDVCPANWQEGKTAMKASDEGMRKYMAEEADNL